jgi:prepilin-type N-terminal cleavage/methylation domain-containing protein
MKKAFTMIEMIFVLVIIGIVAAVIIPRTRTNPLQEAAVQIVSHIRYTQHLALIDDKYDANDTSWYKGRWQIVFHNNVAPNNDVAYTIFSDAGAYGGDASVGEIAKNPEDNVKLLSGGYGATIPSTDTRMTKKMNLTASYGITSVTFGAACNANGSTRIAFDNNGRPFHGMLSSMTGPYSAGTKRLITSDCTLTFSDGSNNMIITIRPETGYASITQY